MSPNINISLWVGVYRTGIDTIGIRYIRNPLSHTFVRQFSHIGVLRRFRAHGSRQRFPVGPSDCKRRSETSGKQYILFFIEIHGPAIGLNGAWTSNSPLADQRIIIASQECSRITSLNCHGFLISEIGRSDSRSRHKNITALVHSHRIAQRCSRRFYLSRRFIITVLIINDDTPVGRLRTAQRLVCTVDSNITRYFTDSDNIARRGNCNAFEGIVFTATHGSCPQKIKFGIIFHDNGIHTATTFNRSSTGKLHISTARTRNIIISVFIRQRAVRLIGSCTTERNTCFKLSIFRYRISNTK